MRPRKVIVLVDADEDSLCRMAYKLDVWGYRVFRNSNIAEAQNSLEDHPLVDLLMVRLLLAGSNEQGLVQWTKVNYPNVKTMVFCDRCVNYPSDLKADATILKGVMTGWHLRDTVKQLTTRKRGPRALNVPALKALELKAVETREAA